jgi:hypothetical protein
MSASAWWQLREVQKVPIDAKHQFAPLGKKVQMSAIPFRVAPIRTCPAPAIDTDLLGD